MKKVFGAMSVMILLTLLLSAWLPAAAAPGQTKVRLLNPPRHGVLYLDVGESETFQIEVRSEVEYLFAAAKVDQYYPGRGIHTPAGDQEDRGTEALLEITITGKNSTAELPAVTDWPWEGEYWPAGVAPVAIVAGMRYDGGQVYAEYFPFMVIVE